MFKGIAEFATDPPELITGDNYEAKANSLFDILTRYKVNIFNISKINSEVRGGKSPRIKRLSEYIGESYFDYLAALPDLVLLMDESHRYRASAGVRAINELKPLMGLELTATPFVETSRGSVAFKNVVLDYPLGKAMADGFVKEPAVVTRKDFNPEGMSTEAIERLKLEDGVRLHEQTKVLLETYARESDQPIVKPFVLVIARDTTHAGQLMTLIQSGDFFEGRYQDKVIQVDSSKTGAEEEAMIARLLKVEHTEEPTEIVIHVNMLKEGWDVTNLYTIVPLRAANARILIEQSIGRGLRLPYGKRTGVPAVDRLSIVAHDRFQEIINEANRPESLIHVQALVLSPEDFDQKTKTVVSQSRLDTMLGINPSGISGDTEIAGTDEAKAFSNPEEERVAQVTRDVIRNLESQPQRLPSVTYLTIPEIRAEVIREVRERYRPAQLVLEGIAEQPDIAAVVAKTSVLVIQQTIDIPRSTWPPKVKCNQALSRLCWSWTPSITNHLPKIFGFNIFEQASRKPLAWVKEESRKRALKTTLSAAWWTSTISPMTPTPICSMTWPRKLSITSDPIFRRKPRVKSCAYTSVKSPSSFMSKCNSTTGKKMWITR